MVDIAKENLCINKLISEKTEIILLIKSFTIPEFARKESVDYDDSIIKIRRKVVRNK